MHCYRASGAAEHASDEPSVRNAGQRASPHDCLILPAADTAPLFVKLREPVIRDTLALSSVRPFDGMFSALNGAKNAKRSAAKQTLRRRFLLK